jgi:hypothetical protein
VKPSKPNLIIFGVFLSLGAANSLAQRGHGGGMLMGGGMPMGHATPPMMSAPARPAMPAEPTSRANSFGHQIASQQQMPASQTTTHQMAAARLSNNGALSARSQALLPPGASVQAAATGFRNQEQFLTTLHASRDLNIPFAQLKSRVTGSQHESLAKAVADVRPGLSRSQIKTDVRTAERQADGDIAAARISTQLNRSGRVQRLLPAGTSLQSAAAGFKNEGQFLAALHVSRNLGIPFSQLKASVTGPNSESLGRAIQDLRPNVSKPMAKADVKLAESQARNDGETMLVARR